MHLCGGYIASVFELPSRHLNTLTLSSNYTYNCSDITLDPDELTTSKDTIEYYCPDGYIYDEANYKCIKGKVDDAFQIRYCLFLSRKSVTTLFDLLIL